MGQPPPFRTAGETSRLVGEIEMVLEGAAKAQDEEARRNGRIRAIQASCAIEANVLNLAEVAALLDGRQIYGPRRDIREVKNAIRAYERLDGWDPNSGADLLDAHGTLMAGLLDDAGRYRRVGVMVAGPEKVYHVGPPPARVPELMENLLAWLAAAPDHPLVASSVFHYEFEFIHPFGDGNGRMGRLWQTLILTRWNSLFAHIPTEAGVYARQQDYYDAIQASSREGESTPFITFMLECILTALRAPRESLVPKTTSNLLAWNPNPAEVPTSDHLVPGPETPTPQVGTATPRSRAGSRR